MRDLLAEEGEGSLSGRRLLLAQLGKRAAFGQLS